MQLRGILVEVEVVLSLKTTFSVWVVWWVVGWPAGENRIKAISSSKIMLKLRLKMSLAKNDLLEQAFIIFQYYKQLKYCCYLQSL